MPEIQVKQVDIIYSPVITITIIMAILESKYLFIRAIGQHHNFVGIYTRTVFFLY